MGLYDTFGKYGAQIKSGPCEMNHYAVGDVVPLADGIHLAYEAAIVVAGGKFVAEFTELTDKWGGSITPREVISPSNPLTRAGV